MPSARSRPSRPRRVAARTLATIAAAALPACAGALLGGCGSSGGGGTSADPAQAVPATAALYAGATVRPTGSQKASALAAGRALTHQADPYLRLLSALQTPGSAKLDFGRDVAPWLGPHAGVFLSSLRSAGAIVSLLQQGLLGSSASAPFAFGSRGAQGAIVMDTTDAAKARSFLHAQAARAGARPRTYKGVSYEASSGGVAFGLVDRFAVIGSESGLRSVVDATHGGAALAHAGGYAKLLAAGPPDALAHVYSNPTGAAAGSSREGPAALLGLLAGASQANVSLVPSARSLTVDADTLAASSPGSPAGLLAPDPQSAEALAQLPGESWLAIGLGHLGAHLARDTQAIQALAGLAGTLGGGGQQAPTGIGLSALLQGMIAPLRALGAPGAQARRDFASWMDSAGIFASGASLLDLRAAVAIDSNNPARSRAAVAKLAARLRGQGASITHVSIPGTDAAAGARLQGLPVVLDIADGRDSSGRTKFVLGLGEASVQTALHPPSTLAAAATRTAAAASLGEGIQPSLIVSFPTLLSLLEGVGLLEAPPLSQLAPYLRSATTLAGGARSLSGQVQRARLVLGLQGAG